MAEMNIWVQFDGEQVHLYVKEDWTINDVIHVLVTENELNKKEKLLNQKLEHMDQTLKRMDQNLEHMDQDLERMDQDLECMDRELNQESGRKKETLLTAIHSKQVAVHNEKIAIHNNQVAVRNEIRDVRNEIRDVRNEKMAIQRNVKAYSQPEYKEMEVFCGITAVNIHTAISDLGGAGGNIKDALVISYPVELPPLKRRIVEGAKPPYCKKSPSDVAKENCPPTFVEVVPVYYNWFAVALKDQWNEIPAQTTIKLEGVDFEVPESRLLNFMDKLKALANDNASSKEYKYSAILCRELDRFIFSDEQSCDGACLAQYPVRDTRRPDHLVARYKNNLPELPQVICGDYKETNLSHAIIETQCYSVNSVQDKFPWFLALPCTKSSLKLELHMTTNQKMLVINIAEVEVCNATKLKHFLCLLYAATHWLLKNPPKNILKPHACCPFKDLVLNSNFECHDRVFLENDVVYKFFKNDGHARVNFEVMTSLGYFKDLKLMNVGSSHKLLSYKLIKGAEEPECFEQIVAAADILDTVHGKELVHADVRMGNILFCRPNKAYIIDFDFTAKVKTCYQKEFNYELSERHPKAKPYSEKLYSHDWYSLGYIAACFFPIDQKLQKLIDCEDQFSPLKN